MVESSGLLNRRRVKNSTGGSNPPLSASFNLTRASQPIEKRQQSIAHCGGRRAASASRRFRPAQIRINQTHNSRGNGAWIENVILDDHAWTTTRKDASPQALNSSPVLNQPETLVLPNLPHQRSVSAGRTLALVPFIRFFRPILSVYKLRNTHGRNRADYQFISSSSVARASMIVSNGG